MNRTNPHAEKIKFFFENIDKKSLADVPKLYAADARFKDPFNDVRGIAAVEELFRDMLRDYPDVRFEISQIVGDPQAHQCVMVWDFYCTTRFPGVRQLKIHGTSLLRFNPSGLVSEHIDYWDAAEQLYEKLPIIGSFLRLIKRFA